MMATGTLLISLDFELFWGMHDCETIESYGQNILGGRNAIPQLLELFKKYDIHASWATVGMLFAESKTELNQYSPEENKRPRFENTLLSSYRMFGEIGAHEKEDPYYYGKSLIDLIAQYPNQEIASHTFSHYYAREAGQTAEAFEADIQAAKHIARDKGYDVKTMVFPRNQSNPAYEPIMLRNDFVAFRGEEEDWIHRIRIKPLMRMLRLADSYINLTGSATYSLERFQKGELHNFHGSRFLRPYNHRLKLFEGLKLRRAKSQMKHAAKKGEVFHLWWHPHNIGVDTERNLRNIAELLDFYNFLNKKYGMKSKNMIQLSDKINNR